MGKNVTVGRDKCSEFFGGKLASLGLLERTHKTRLAWWGWFLDLSVQSSILKDYWTSDSENWFLELYQSLAASFKNHCPAFVC